MTQRSPLPPSESLETLPGPLAAPGLVTSAISRENAPAGCETPSTASGLYAELRGHFAFPSADLVGIAAGMFVHNRSDRQSSWRPSLDGDSVEWDSQRREGAVGHFTIGPGMVRLEQLDLNRRDLAAERAVHDRRRSIDLDVQSFHAPMVWAAFGDAAPATRSVVSEWSRKSRARLVRTIASLDLAPLVAVDRIPCMVTLTLPGDWLALTPDSATAARFLDNFARRWRDRWGVAPAWIWKREFQRRGAPHWHLWLVPPTDDAAGFREWVSSAWTQTIKPSREVDKGRHVESRPGVRCVCSEWCRSLAAGTGVDYAEGMRARDSRRLAIYFLKETLGGEGKAYQNGPPSEWDGQSVGRFWGVRGIKPATATVRLDPERAAALWRIMRTHRERSIPLRVEEVRSNSRTGELRRPVTRSTRVTVYGKAGWLAVNDGPAFAEALARHLFRDPLPRSGYRPRDPSTMPASTWVDKRSFVN